MSKINAAIASRLLRGEIGVDNENASQSNPSE
jgi:hypothetical protein